MKKYKKYINVYYKTWKIIKILIFYNISLVIKMFNLKKLQNYFY